MLAQILDAVARLVGEFAEVDLVGVARAGEHADVGAGAEHPRLARAQHHDLDLRVLEAQPLDGVSELDVDAEVVGVELEVVALEQRALLVHVEEKRGHVAVDVELPMAVARRLGLEIDSGMAVGQRPFSRMLRVSHRTILDRILLRVLYYNASSRRQLICTILHQAATPESIRGSPSRWSRSSRLMKPATASSVASGASRCGE